MKKIVLIPSYEPKEKFINLCEALIKEDVDIVVVDDGSGVLYKNIFKRCEKYAKVLSYKENMGKGYALKYGYKYIKEKYKDNYIIVTMDSDFQHTIRDAMRLIDEVQKDNDALVLGKRLRGKNTPFRSKFGNSFTRFLFRIVSGVDVYDTQTGLRSFSYKLIDKMINIEGDRFEYEMNVLLYLAKDKVKIKEIEIETIYIDDNSGSHFNAIRDSYKIYKNIFKFIFRRRT